MNLNNLKEEVYQTAVEHGWHDEEYSHKHFLCLVISELMEAVQAVRTGRYANRLKFEEWQNGFSLTEETRLRRFKEDFEAYIKDSVEDELADACIRLLDFAGVTNTDIRNVGYGAYDMKDYTELTFTECIFSIVEIICRNEVDITHVIDAIFSLCGSRGIGIYWHINQKMEYNRYRTYKHGNKVF